MRMLMMKRSIRSVCAVLGSAVLLSSASYKVNAADKFKFAFPNVITIVAAPFSFASQLGYFEDENIDLEMPVLISSGVAIPQLIAGTIDTTYIALNGLPISKQEGGPDYPFRYAYNYARRSLYEVVVLESSPIRSLAELGGKTVGVGGVQWGNVPSTKAALNAVGVDVSTVDIAAVGDGVPALEALRKGDIDALNLYDTKNIIFEQSGVKLRRLAFPTEFADASSSGMPFTNQAIEEKPELIGRFGRAVTKGIVACKAALENCIRAHWAMYPEQKPSEDKMDAAIEASVEILGARLENLTTFRPGEEGQYGSYADADWQPLLTALKDGGVIANDQVPMSELYTNEFVSAYNDFDLDQVISEAKAYK